jgi:hypothetical protein
VIFAGYSASLISSLALQERVLPFRDLEGLLQDGSYRLGVMQNSAPLNIFDVINCSSISKIIILPLPPLYYNCHCHHCTITTSTATIQQPLPPLYYKYHYHHNITTTTTTTTTINYK